MTIFARIQTVQNNKNDYVANKLQIIMLELVPEEPVSGKGTGLEQVLKLELEPAPGRLQMFEPVHP